MKLDLISLKQAAERATKGPWKWDGTVWNYDESEEAPWLVSPVSHEIKGSGYVKVVYGQVQCSEANAAYIAAANPAVIIELIRQRGVMKGAIEEALVVGVVKWAGAKAILRKALEECS